jgi:nitrile hydratase accessory protein
MTLSGEAAPPMANGEIVFEAPWQSRVFGMARAMCEQDFYDWDEFRAGLIREIGQHEQSDASYQYFDYFLTAFTALLDEKGFCVSGELDARSLEFAARPHGHDH